MITSVNTQSVEVVTDDIAPLSLWRRIVARPEIGAAASTIVVFAFFALVAGSRGFLTSDGTVNYLQVAAELGIIVVPVTLLMIAGEFDLSVASVLAAAGIIVGYLTAEEGWAIWTAAVAAIAVAGALGFVNGILVMKTRLPSFIVTLASLFAIRGLTIALTQEAMGGTTIVSNVPREGALLDLFAGTFLGIPASVYWWIALVLVAWYVLARTRFGNWTFGVGGDKESARRLGVPTARLKVTLFVMTASAAGLVGVIQTLLLGSGDVGRGAGLEFVAIAAAVIGGTLLAGGFGSALGAALGALIFGMVSQGIFYTSIDGNWFQLILGVMLLGAAWINHVVRERTTGVRVS